MDIIEGQISLFRGEHDMIVKEIEHYHDDGMKISDREAKVIIDIPADGSYVEIFGHKLNGDFGNFQGFCDYLIELDRTQSNWNSLKKWLENEIDEYENDKWCSFQDIVRGGAMKKLLEKMKEFENNGRVL